MHAAHNGSEGILSHVMTPDSPGLSNFDPFGMPLRVRPREVLAELIGSSPGLMMVEGRLSAYVADYRGVCDVARDYESFSSVKPADVPGMNRFDFFNGKPVMNYSDPPEHTRRRRVVNAAFTRRRIEQLEAQTLAIFEDVTAGLPTGEVVDVLKQLCSPVISEVLLGAFMNVAPIDRHALYGLLAQRAALDNLGTNDPKPASWLAAWEVGAAYCRDAVAKARARKDESLIGLIAGALGDGTIDDDEVLAMMMVLLTGGMTTMIAATSSALYWLARYPALKQRVRETPELAAAALDEAMRIFPPITFSMRFAMRDTEVNGRLIPAGAPVYVLWAGANQDPAVFPEPGRYDPDRPNVRAHVAFGFGVHNCIGNHVTRQVGTTVVRAMIERYPDFALARPEEEPEFLTDVARSRHLASLHMNLGRTASSRR
jgi:cytochrome P450